MEEEDGKVVCLDKLTYAGNMENLKGLPEGRLEVQVGDVCDGPLLRSLLERHRPRAVVHLAAESHVDRSILGPADFIQTNIVGTFTLLEAARCHLEALRAEGAAAEAGAFRLLHVSTDEVYGSLGPEGPGFNERTAYDPSSPYSASKASADHLARAWYRTYGLPVMVTNCSNNYGPYQHPEKLIPLMILKAQAGEALPVYGDGAQVRDWLHALDHSRALRLALRKGIPGETYNIGGGSERTNLEVVRMICSILDRRGPLESGAPRETLIKFVKDRPGHDRRYAIDASKAKRELGFEPGRSFDEGLEQTVGWYLDNREWALEAASGRFRDWLRLQYGGRG
jgi:dTDP-glucose 4,6-dehydratase